MASVNSDLGVKHLEHDLVKLVGFVATDSNGDVRNANASTPKDDFGNFLYIPKEINSIARVELGLYRFVLRQDWYQLRNWNLDVYVPRAQAQASLLGNVDLNGITLSSLNGLTVKLNATGGGLVTTTFSSVSSIQNIADQINTAETGASKNGRAEIITMSSGAKFLRCYDLTAGTTSSITADATSTGTTALGITTGTTPTGQALGDFILVAANPWSKVVDFASVPGSMGRPARTLDFIYTNGAGVGLNLISAGFHFELTLKNTNVP